MDLVWRFVIGGLVVSAFSAIGDLFKPKSFAGLFGAAPSVAIATIAMAMASHGGQYVSVEGRSMLVGAVALFAYSQVTALAIMRGRLHALPAAASAFVAWFLVAFGLLACCVGTNG